MPVRSHNFRFVPGLRAIKEYRKEWLPSDLVAGVTLGAVMIPVGLAFGELAGLPMAGLYAAILPLLAYALFGSSRQVIVSPDASMATLVAVSVVPLAGDNTTRFALLAGVLAVMIGLICIFGAVLRLGFMADFLAKPVISGYMHGLAAIIFVGQLPQALGIEVGSQKNIAQLMEIVRKLPQASLPSLAISVGCVLVILGFRRWLPRIPGQLIAMVVAMGSVSLFALQRFGVSVIGKIPRGLPDFHVPLVEVKDLSVLLPMALAGAVLAFSDSIVTVRAFASRNRYQVDANQELLALGMASITSGFTQGLPLSASGSRTAVAEAAGSRTQVTSVVAAIVVAIVLLLLTGLLRFMPRAALSGILIAAAYSLCDYSELKRMWRFRGVGFACAVITFLTIFFFDVLKGTAAGVICSIILLVRAISFPRDTAVTAFADGSLHESDIESEFPSSTPVLIYRLFGPLFFANCTQFRSHIERLTERLCGPNKVLIVDCNRILFVDLAGCDTIVELVQELTAVHSRLVLAAVHPRLQESFRRGGVTVAIGESSIFTTLDAALSKVMEVE
jgi:high affinity sulfate transporter 1